MRNHDTIKKQPVAPPALAARVYRAKDKRDEQVDLRSEGVIFTDERPITSSDKSLNLILKVRVQVPIGRIEKQKLEDPTFKLMYFELLAKEAGQEYTVVQCHCQASDHGDVGPMHVHRAIPNGNRPEKQTVTWPGVDNTTRVSEAFAKAMHEMDIEAEYQHQ